MLWIDYIPERKTDNSMKVVEESCFESRILTEPPKRITLNENEI